ncbi:MAG: hypothetical protein E7017_02505 [Alphaproteobacteria bacterium]|nr:hypothetical protein [Alphaproteobacteria bacterium]
MYVWVVLTTFLAMIAAYVLPIRPDMHEKTVVPVAQARVMQLVAKQRAASQYMLEREWPYYSDPYERKVDYKTGEITSEMMADYLPFGFIDNTDYVTALYCMNDDMTVLKTGEGSCDKVNDTKISRMLITYGPIPEKWQNVTLLDGGGYDIKPSLDIMDAFRLHFSKKDMIGYVIIESGKWYIVNYEGTKYQVPSSIVDNIGMSHYSLKACVNDFGTCLAFMSRR